MDKVRRSQSRKDGRIDLMSKSEDEIRQRARMEWSAAAPGWKKYGKDMFKWLAPVSDQLIRSAGITSGQIILDVATGTGQPALTIAKK
jgi:hypothetical protein